jgi:hypothetical protein
MGEAILYVLAAPLPGTRTPAYLMHQVGGVDCVLAYTDREHLVECCGEHQPWLGIRIDALMADLRDQRLPGPVVNLALAPGARWTADGPPWDRSGLGEADPADEPGPLDEPGQAAAAGDPAPVAGEPESGASEFAGWSDEDRTDAGSASPASAGGADTVTVSVSVTRQEWWR